MTLTLTSFISALLYIVASIIQGRTLAGQQQERRQLVLLVAMLAVAMHTYSVYRVLHTPTGIHLGLFTVGSLVAWLIAGIVTLSSLRKPLANLFVGIFPLAALAALLPVIGPVSGEPKPYSGGLISHILTSILAYSIFAIGAVQAVLLACQNHELKSHHTKGIIRSLPPLQVMETLLFDMLWVGFVLLSISLVTGILFLDDIFAQHLVHKTVLSIAAWVVYATLLWGRHQQGWRGMTAIRWSIGGFAVLMLAYFGSKFVLELIFSPL